MRSSDDTIAALATPLGESGVGVIRLSGSASLSVVQSLFQSTQKIDLTTVSTHTCHVGIFGKNKPIDKVVVTVFRSPHSYTGEDVVEISSHGSPFILQQILQACYKQGVRPSEPGEFTQRAFLAGKIDLTQAEAVADLIRAKTDESHAAAMGQLEGNLAVKVRSLRDVLLPLLAHVEVGLDHSDEDHSFLSRENLVVQCQTVKQEVDALIESAKVGKILREGLKIALVGRPNVGKSSLLNALLKEERAIVTPIPGTTRDTLEESLNWEGVPVVLTDTAGVRQGSDDPVEHLGMERSRKALQSADIVLCVLDASEPFSNEDQDLVKECLSKTHIWVVNKVDLPARWERRQLETLNGRSPAVSVSAKTGEGLEYLVQTVTNLIWPGKTSTGSARWMINARHQMALGHAREALVHAIEAAQGNAFEECVALELQTALHALGEIIGESSTEDLLDNVFSNFCIGK